MKRPDKEGYKNLAQLFPLRVLHIASGDLWAGAEVQVYHMVRTLSREPCIEVQAVLLNEGRLARELRGTGVKITVLDEQQLGSLQLISYLNNLLQQFRPHILHSHRYKENVLGALAAKCAGTPHVVSTIHGLPEPGPWGSRWRGGLENWANRLVLRYLVSHLIPVSSDIASSIEELAQGQLSVVGNSVSLDGLWNGTDPNILRQSFGIAPGYKIIGVVGRLVPVKGMDLFVECAIKLVQMRKDLSCMIVGEGPEQFKLKEYISKNGVKERIILTGFQENIFDVMNLFDVLMIPSRHEGIPTALLEALALGKGVVATSVGGIPEVVQHNVNGILVPPGDVSSWVPTILFLLDHPEEAHRLGARGQRDVAEKWSVSRQSRQLCDIYRKLSGDSYL